MNRIIPGLVNLQINNIFCIGRNYALHAREMNSTVPDRPVVFLKPNSSVLYDGGTVVLPPGVSDVQHEVELVVAIGKEGRNIRSEKAEEFIAGIGIGIDMTARELQTHAKEKGNPWSVSKGFDTFAPVSSFMKDDDILSPEGYQIELKVNGVRRQKGSTTQMIFNIPYLISYLSSVFTLQPGDLLFTGTPKGVAPVKSGDKLSATLNSNQLTLDVDVR